MNEFKNSIKAYKEKRTIFSTKEIYNLLGPKYKKSVI